MEKLVRDLIPDLMLQSGKQPRFRAAAHSERLPLLLAKLIEEAEELLQSPSLAELVDVSDVMSAIQVELGIDTKVLQSARAAKLAERGGFDCGFVLELDEHG